MTFDINHRSRKILYAVVSEYLSTGEAVGSRTITRRHGIELSAATIRNVMADLDELFQRTSRVLSDITHYAGIVLVPNPARQRLRHIEFVALASGRFLCILVTQDGR